MPTGYTSREEEFQCPTVEVHDVASATTSVPNFGQICRKAGSPRNVIGEEYILVVPYRVSRGYFIFLASWGDASRYARNQMDGEGG
jgi:hypothetical protein